MPSTTHEAAPNLQPNPFSHRTTDTGRWDHFLPSRAAGQNPDWKFDMSAQQPHAAAPSTVEEQVRLNTLYKVNTIFQMAELHDRRPESLQLHVAAVMNHIDQTAGKFTGNQNPAMWEALIISALDKAALNLWNPGDNTNPIAGLTEVVRDQFHDFEMNNLQYDRVGYLNYIANRAAMRRHPHYQQGAVPLHVEPIIRTSHVQDPFAASHQEAPSQPFRPQPIHQSANQPRQQPQTEESNTEMNTANNSNTSSNNTGADGVHVHVHADSEGTKHVHIDSGKPGQAESNSEKFSEHFQARREAAGKVKIEMAEPTFGSRAKTAAKWIGGAAVVAGLSYAGYRAYKAGMFGALKNVVTTGIPAAADAIQESAETGAATAQTVQSFFG